MGERYLLGIDIGTYSSKGVIVREDGGVVASATADHELSLPRPGYAEHDPQAVWWDDLRTLCRELINGSAIEPRHVAGIGISAISPAIVVTDEEGTPLRPAILYGIDTRASAETDELARLTGATLSSQSAAPKVLWIRRNEQEAWKRARWIHNGPGWLVFRLTGQACIDVYDSSLFEPFFDAAALQWEPALDSMVAPVAMMPRPSWTCDQAGTVTAGAARETGLAEGTPVIVGTADAAAEAVSAGLTSVGDMMLMYGSSTFFILRTPSLLSPLGFWGTRFLEPGTYAVAGGTATAGSITRWFRDAFAPTELEAEREGRGDAYAALGLLAESSPAGSRGLVALPYFSGERTPLHDPEAKGLIFGLTLTHSRADIYRSLLESVGYSIRHNIEAMRAVGCSASRILAVGGGTRNPSWLQMISDIAGITQVVPQQRIGASYGDAFLAGVGIGLFSGTADVHRWVRQGRVITPNPAHRAVYERLFRIYRDLYEATAPSMHELSSVARLP